jgi:hypothetical protein
MPTPRSIRLLPPTAEVRGSDIFIIPQHLRLALHDQPDGFQHIATGRDRERHMGVLLHQQHRGALWNAVAAAGVLVNFKIDLQAVVQTDCNWPRFAQALN